MLPLALVAAAAGQPAPPPVTFSEHIAPIVYAQCAGCHRPGQAAPFPLQSYADARRHARTALRVIRDREMPPWQPEPGHGEFRGERRLTAAQIDLFGRWVEAGMPEGDATKAPAPPAASDGWPLGTPQKVVEMKVPFVVPADGPDIYQNFVLPLDVAENKWVTAVDFKASAPAVVHHLLYFADTAGRGRAEEKAAKAKGKTDQPGFPGLGFRPTSFLGGWAVGGEAVKLPGGLALPLGLPKDKTRGTDLVVQAHFHPSGKAESVTLTFALYFATEKPARTLVRLQLPPHFGLFSNVDIPAGKADFKVADRFTLPVDVDLVGAAAHAHYLGKSLKTTATLPDGTTKSLFYVKDWNFNWQGQYLYKEFVRLPKGTVLKGEVVWDNSTANPRNPRTPPTRVKWGEGSTDEMGSIGLSMVAAQEKDTSELQMAIRLHTLEVLQDARRKGYVVDWDRLGVPPPKEWTDPLPPAPGK